MKSLLKARTALALLAVVALVTFSAATVWKNEADRAAVNEVKAHVEKSYINGAFNLYNWEDMQAGFHEDFAIFTAKGDALNRYEIEDWVANAKKRREAEGYDPVKNKWVHQFKHVDVTGNAASVAVEMYNPAGVHTFTDYLSLLKFEDEGWKIVAKIYHRHPQKK